jgi:hypothetical protein
MSNLTDTIAEILAKSEVVSEKTAGDAVATLPALDATPAGAGMRKLASYMRGQDAGPSYSDLQKLLGDLDA